MLTFKNIRWIFLLAFVLTTASYFFLEFPWYYLILPPFLYSLVLAVGSAFIGLGFFVKSVCKAETNQKTLSLSFDDGPDATKTPLILETLKVNQIKASFFVIGKKIKGNEALLKQIREEGHIIANHSFSHSYFYDFYPTKKVIEDLRLNNNTIKEIIGLTPTLFRPPYGVTNPNIARAVKQLELISIGWNVRSLDTVITDTNKLLKRVTDRIKPGSILLFHDTGSNTLETLKEIILFAQKNGYRIVSLTELLKINAYEES